MQYRFNLTTPLATTRRHLLQRNASCSWGKPRHLKSTAGTSLRVLCENAKGVQQSLMGETTPLASTRGTMAEQWLPKTPLLHRNTVAPLSPLRYFGEECPRPRGEVSSVLDSSEIRYRYAFGNSPECSSPCL